MANRTFYLKVYASDRIFFEGQCQTLVIPQSDGLRAIQAHHEDMVLAVDIGEAHIVEEDGTVTYVVVGSGMVQIFQEHRMSQASLARALTRLKESSKYNA